MTKKIAAGSTLPLVHRGSVKDIRAWKHPGPRRPGRFVFEFTDDYSVFDYGKMPDRIRGKGFALAMMSAHLFELAASPSTWRVLFRDGTVWEALGGSDLRDRLRASPAARLLMANGLKTHYLGMINEQGRPVRLQELRAPSNRLLVQAVPVVGPKRVVIHGRGLWDYSPVRVGLPQFLIPLENVFRFGVPRGSSLLARVRKDPAYKEEIGLDAVPVQGTWLPRPVLEFFTKLEPMDRHLRVEQAMNYSGLTGEEFEQLSDLTLLTAIFLFHHFRVRGLDLWDGKLEFIKTRAGILLADSITPDELRITYKGIQLSKEPLRQYYKRKDPGFCRAMEALKAADPGGSIRRALRKRLGRGPRSLDPGFRRIIEGMYQALAFRITGSRLLEGAMDLDEVARALRPLGRG